MSISAIDSYDAGFYGGLAADLPITVSDWADRYRVLNSVSSSEPGQWNTWRTPYLREIMDHLSPDHPCERVVFEAGAQLGKTETGNNFLGFIIHCCPAPTLMVQPTVDVAKRVSKQRIAPMIAATPVLRARVAESRSRDSGNTVQVKEFDGGMLIMTGANSSAGLRSMPIRFLFMDEVDNYPGDVGGQGDPIALAEKRTATFSRRKILLTSTPTIRGLSRIEQEFLTSDMRYYHVPCQRCGYMDFLTWSGFRDHTRQKDGGHHRIEWIESDPSTAHMVCGECGEITNESEKTAMLEAGEWRPTATARTNTVGYHLSSLYSPVGWKSWASCAEEFLSAKTEPFKLKAWVNTVLAETWEERGEWMDPETLMGRKEPAWDDIPDGVGVIVAAVDVQNDRLELVVMGYGEKEESWLLRFEQIYGDPAHESVWGMLDRSLSKPMKHSSGKIHPIECTVIDSGGLHTEYVYKYCKARAGKRVFAIKGGSVVGRPLVNPPSIHNRYKVPLFVLCVDTGKDLVVGRLGIGKPGPGFYHLPDWVDDEFIFQLTAERAVRRYVKGRGSFREWVKLRERNEAFDLYVYALAALYILGPRAIASIPERRDKWLEKEGENPEVVEAQERQIVRPRRGWMSSWR